MSGEHKTAPAHGTEDQRRNPDTWGGEAPAYPWGDVTNGGVMGGLTKRELLAAIAPAEIVRTLAAHIAMESGDPGEFEKFGGKLLVPPLILAQRYAHAAALYADALLKELAK